MEKNNFKKRKLLAAIIVISFVLFFIISDNIVTEWLRERWLEIFIAFIFAIIAGYIYEKIKPKPDSDKKTKLIPKPSTVLAELVLPNSNKIKIKEYEKERIFGRANFQGAISSDDLPFISKEHFQIIKMDDGLYIEDMESANGTKLNGEEIKGSGKKKLNNGDEILIADVLKIRYVQE
jgi:hypothetical protein